MSRTRAIINAMEIVELDSMSQSAWDEVIAGEREPFGGVGERLTWAEKSTTLAIRSDHGQLLACGGIVSVPVTAGASAPFHVIGLGGVIVTRSARGRGLARTLVARLLELARELGPQHAMLFCLPALIAFYERFSFEPIDAPVTAQQPQGRVQVPLRAMHTALRSDARWPAGPVEVLGEPF